MTHQLELKKWSQIEKNKVCEIKTSTLPIIHNKIVMEIKYSCPIGNLLQKYYILQIVNKFYQHKLNRKEVCLVGQIFKRGYFFLQKSTFQQQNIDKKDYIQRSKITSNIGYIIVTRQKTHDVLERNYSKIELTVSCFVEISRITLKYCRNFQNNSKINQFTISKTYLYPLYIYLHTQRWKRVVDSIFGATGSKTVSNFLILRVLTKNQFLEFFDILQQEILQKSVSNFKNFDIFIHVGAGGGFSRMRGLWFI
eukprot:TRINITY_DN39441_c0_g1_i2.p2 TRINITY_DN39441_c0_g1~~TRINITY_DN39441_c0_g1_i2.p2  ORF type:complete len:252 (-),score=-6.16 TRINITY_DN39441_c0_g1_i2:16-771(-)